MMKINLWGQRNIFGGGIHFSSFSDALSDFSGFGSLLVEYDPFGSDLRANADQTCSDDVNIFFVEPAHPIRVRGAVVKWAIFESDKLPDAYLEYLSHSHLIWVPSDWGKHVLVNAGISSDQIQVIPEGVDSSTFHPFMRPRMAKDDIFRFYMCGKYEERKGFAELLDAFDMAYGNDPGVRLYLKSDNFHSDLVLGTNKNSDLREHLKEKNLTNVRLVTGVFSALDLALINSHMDAQIFPSRAEGWGLPLLEGIASGLPTVCNFYSGQTQFLKPIKNELRILKHSLEPVPDLTAIGQSAPNSMWAVAPKDEIAAAMVEIRSDHSQWLAKAFRASSIVRESFSWTEAAEKGLNSLIERSIIQPEWSVNI